MKTGFLKAARVLAVAGATAAVVACGPDPEEQAAVARAEEWTAIEEMKAALDSKRSEAAELAAKVAAGVEGFEVAEGESAEEALAAAEEQLRALAGEADGASQALGERIVAFINDDPMEQGAEPTELQAAALDMKAQEDWLIAEEFINEGGDWAQAGSIVENLLRLAPTNEFLLEKQAWIEDMRFVNRERFDQLENGMTQDQVREILGPVNINNIKEFDDNNTGWFYRKDPDAEGGAAGVYFRKRRGEYLVNNLDYEAIKPS